MPTSAAELGAARTLATGSSGPADGDLVAAAEHRLAGILDRLQAGRLLNRALLTDLVRFLDETGWAAIAVDERRRRAAYAVAVAAHGLDQADA